MEQYTTERPTNIMGLTISTKGSLKTTYHYVKPTVSSCKCTFADGSKYFQKTIANDKLFNFRGEDNKLYIDEECATLAPVTRRQKIRECKRLGLI